MGSPEISVIVCSYNRSHLLANVLQNFRNQSFPDGHFTWELVIVDNNSTDQTSELVQHCIARGDLPIKYLFEPRQGKSYALNTGVRLSNGHLLAFTDDDVVLDSDWLSSIYKAFKTYPYNCFGGKVVPIINETLPSWLTDQGQFTMYGGPIGSHDRGNQIKEYDETMWVPAGSNMFVRKQVFEKYGLFNTQLGFLDKNMHIEGEDSELLFRFKKNGESILYYPDAVVYHPFPADRLKKSYFKARYWGSGRAKARWLEVPPETVRYFNIPRYLIRQSLEQLVRLLLALGISKEYKKFYHEVYFLHILGMVYEFYMNGE